MIHFMRKSTNGQWIVIVGLTLVLGSFALDALRGQFAFHLGTAEAKRDIAAGKLNFRVGGKPRAWFNETANAFRARYGASLIHSHGCVATSVELSYDSAYNTMVSNVISERTSGFAFRDAYNEMDTEGRTIFMDRLAIERE